MRRFPAVLLATALSSACTGTIVSPAAEGPSDGSTAPAADAAPIRDAAASDDATTSQDVGFADGGIAADAVVKDGGDRADAAVDDAGQPSGAPRFVFVGDEGVWASSAAGEQWTQSTPTGQYVDLLRDVTYGDGLFYAVGGGDNTHVVLGSPDGVTWTPLGGPPYGWLGGAAWLPSEGALVVAGSNGQRYRSLDRGQTFIDESPFESCSFRDVAYGAGRVVAIGDSYDTDPPQAVSSTTQDGRQWTPLVVGGPPFVAITFGNGMFVAVGNEGRVSRSTDGVTWRDVTIGGASFISSVSFGDGRFLLTAAGAGYESTDGETWTAIGPIPDVMVYGNGMWVGINFLGQSFTSSDGRQWTPTRGAGLPGRSGVFGFVRP